MSAQVGPIVEVKDLTVDFAAGRQSVHAVCGVDLSLRPGETLALLGESGSGKSVTLRSLMRLHPRSARIGGTLTVDGRNVLAMSAAELTAYRGKTISMIFQDPGLALDPVYRIGDQIAETVMWHEGCSRATGRQRGLELFERVRIPSPAQRQQLSTRNVWRYAPARHDCVGARLSAEGVARRRTDDGARCHRADPSAAAAA